MSDSSRPRRIVMIAGEASGDYLGAELAEQIYLRMPNAQLSGLAGERMRAAGVEPIVRVEDVAGMGATELSSTLIPTLRAFQKLRRILKEAPPDLLILIDFADFNLKFAWFARRAGVRVLYYVPPQVWAWRRWRIQALVRRADRLAVVFPFEAEMYERAGGRVSFVGHPMLDRVKPQRDRASVLADLGLSPRSRILAILPGSRRAEIRHLLRPMLDAARVLCADHDLTPVIILASTLSVADLTSTVGSAALEGVQVVERDPYSIVAGSELALVASGTATLETALLGCPMVIAYRLSGASYAIGRVLVHGVDFIGMPNLLAGRALVPELIQHDVTSQNLIRAAEPMLAPSMHAEVAEKLRELRYKMGEPGAAGRVAMMALEMLNETA
jgi:lipid-A-disaccharide synthase